MITKNIGSILAFTTALSAMTPARAQEKKQEFKETFTAFAIVTGNVATGASTTVQMTITRWSTDAEREQLLSTLIEKGQEKFIDALRDQKENGFIRITGRGAGLTRFPSQRLRYAREFRDDKGNRTIVLGLDRPISFAEASRNSRSSDYDVTLILLKVDAEGKGEGQMAAGVKLAINKEKKELEIEHYSTEPVRLTNVKKQK